MNVDHRGFFPLPQDLQVIKLDATLSSDLKWKVDPFPQTLWELEFGELSSRNLPTYRIAVHTFVETVWEQNKQQTLGLILYRGRGLPYDLEELADMLHQLGAILPDEIPPFALFDLEIEESGCAQQFSKELFSHIHLGFRKAPFGALEWKECVTPLYHSAKIGVSLPLRKQAMHSDTIDACMKELEKRNIPYRLISEMYLTEEWDGLDELIIFPSLLSKQGERKIQGFTAAGGRIWDWEELGAEGFEPPTFCSQSRCASQAALYPVEE